ncbi:hypothetical protein [Zhihengliuella halotolerans]|uniref:hypothetical protein n=1 Tax=Zhihengliuella halotolerans TaxID=370736 RepID=UPI000C7FFD1F|nr:hypothetical protein [Zhihengliuella halotolerans]
MTQTQSIAAKAAAATQKAEAAREHARSLQAEAELAEAHDAELRENKRDEFLKERRANLTENFIKPLRAHRATFEEAVLADEGVVPAWIAYKSAVNAAENEERMLATSRHAGDVAKFEAVSGQLNQWQQELMAIREKQIPLRRAFTAEQEPAGSWSKGIEKLIGEDKPRDGENRAEQINRRLNELAKVLGVEARRDPNSLEWFHILDYTSRPSQPMSETAPTGRENRSMHQAIEDIISKRLEETSAASRRQWDEDLETYING